MKSHEKYILYALLAIAVIDGIKEDIRYKNNQRDWDAQVQLDSVFTDRLNYQDSIIKKFFKPILDKTEQQKQ